MKLLESNLKINNAVLYFNNDGCSLCYTEKKVIHDLEKNMKQQIPIYSIDARNQKDLVKKYEILSVPSIVFIKNGQKVDQFNKYLNGKQIETVFTYYFGTLDND